MAKNMNTDFPDIKNYEIIRRIGKGGFGEVYLAKSANSAFVAVKVIPSENAKREAEALKKYTSLATQKSLIKILDSGEIEKAIYYVMPLADTLESDFNFPPTDFRWQEKSLAKLIDRKLDSPKNEWFSRDEILSYILPIFDAAIFLGENAMLHRDIKPDNILFFENQATLSDFGLLEKDRRSLSNAGTPLYLAPSWYINKGGNPDAYGLATTFYTLITGNLPDAIGRPAYRFPDKIADSISDYDKEQWLHWHRCIMRAIAENSTERFLTLQDFRNAIVSEDFSSSINFEQSEDVSKGNNAKLYAALAALAAAAGGTLLYTSQSDIENSLPTQIQEIAFDEQLFKQIYDFGFSDKATKISIDSYSNWLKQKQQLIADFEKELKQAKKTSNKTSEQIVAEVNKKYQKEFDEKFGNMYGNSNSADYKKGLRGYLKANKKWIDEEIQSQLDSVEHLNSNQADLIENIAELNSQIKNPEIYKRYVISEYSRYKKISSFYKKK